MKNKAIDYIQVGDERLPVFISAVFGSHNYNLNTPNSDVDMRYFFCPTFHHIYTNKEITKSSTSTEMDYVAHDIRKLPGFLDKSNPNTLEIMFSVDLKGMRTRDMTKDEEIDLLKKALKIAAKRAVDTDMWDESLEEWLELTMEEARKAVDK